MTDRFLDDCDDHLRLVRENSKPKTCSCCNAPSFDLQAVGYGIYYCPSCRYTELQENYVGSQRYQNG